MTVKQQLIAEIEGIDNPTTLSQLFEILQLVKQNIQIQPKQKNPVTQFAGCFDDDEAQAMRTTIDGEFNNIETKFMNNIQELEMAVSQLSANELMQFSEWFEEFMSDQWDKKIVADILAGRLDAAGKRADDEFLAGRASPL